MALFNPQQRRFYRDIFGQFHEGPITVSVNAAGIVSRVAGTVATTAASAAVDTITGRTRSGRTFRNDEQPTGQVIRHSAGDDTGTPVHRRISTGENMPRPIPLKAPDRDLARDVVHDEVEVVPPPNRIAKILPDYTTISLPFYTKFTVTAGMVNSTNFVGIRLNSIYDPIVGVTANQQPQGRDRWAVLFNFYRVLQSNVKLTWLNHQFDQGVPLPSSDIWVIGYELIDDGQEVSQDVDAFMVTKHAKREMLGPAPKTSSYNGTTVVFSPTAVASQVVTHQYQPETWDYHVQEKSIEERWTPILQNPATNHFMAIRTFGLDGQALEADQMELLVQIEYVVQFREISQSFIKQSDSTGATYGGPGQDPTDSL